MPTNKHKRKATAHVKPKTVKVVRSSGIITTHPKLFLYAGVMLVALGIYLLAFEAQNNAMFGFAMLALIAGVVTAIYANFAGLKKKHLK